MSWVALPVEPACMGRRSVKTRRAGAGQTVIVIGACKRKVLCRS